MRRSKQEIYLDILKTLAHWGPLKLTHVIYKSNVNCRMLEKYLSFLVKQALVEEKILMRKRKVYAITQRGVTLLTYFKELCEALPIVEETGKSSRH